MWCTKISMKKRTSDKDFDFLPNLFLNYLFLMILLVIFSGAIEWALDGITMLLELLCIRLRENSCGPFHSHQTWGQPYSVSSYQLPPSPALTLGFLNFNASIKQLGMKDLDCAFCEDSPNSYHLWVQTQLSTIDLQNTHPRYNLVGHVPFLHLNQPRIN